MMTNLEKYISEIVKVGSFDVDTLCGIAETIRCNNCPAPLRDYCDNYVGEGVSCNDTFARWAMLKSD